MLSTPFVAAQDLLAGKARSTAALGSLDGVQIVTAFVLDDIVIGEVHIAGVPVAGLDHWQSDSAVGRSEEHTSELKSLMRISYAVFCLNKTNNNTTRY